MKSPIVKDWMTTTPIAISPYTSLGDASHLMSIHDARTLPIVNEQKSLMGVITRRDLLRFDSSLDLNMMTDQYLGMDSLNVERIMTLNPTAVTQKDYLKFAAKLLIENKFNALPVLDDNKTLVGMLTTPDLFNFLLSSSDILELSFPVKKIMKSNLVVLSQVSTLAEAREIMLEKRIRSLPIVDNEKLVGIITRTDILRAIPSALSGPPGKRTSNGIETTPIRYIMTSRPITISSDTLIPETIRIMLEQQIHSLPILDEKNKLIGIITETDLFQLVFESLT